jgi:drug/metabolite transporter (DMT)-like permease
VALADKKIPTKLTTFGIIIATFGLGLLSLDGLSIAKGDFLILMCSFAFAIHIYAIDQLGKEEDTIAITVIQLLTVSILSIFSMFLFEPSSSITWSSNVFWGLALTAIPATSIAFLFQNKFQKYTTPTHTALIFASEPVFSYIFAFILVGEVLTVKYTVGAFLILLGIILSELKIKQEVI